MRYIGTIREYIQDGILFAILQGMPGFPANLVVGANQVDKKEYLIIRQNIETGVVENRKFVGTLVAAEAVFVVSLRAVGKTVKPFNIQNISTKDAIQKWMNIEE